MKDNRRKNFTFALLYTLEQIGRFFAIFGRCLCKNYNKCLNFLGGLYRKTLSPLNQKIAGCFKKIANYFCTRWECIVNFFVRVWHVFGIIREDVCLVWKHSADLPLNVRLKKVMRSLVGPVKKRKRMVISTLNYVMPVVALLVAVNMISGLIHTDYAFAVTYNGVELGYIEDETVYDDAAKDLQSRIIIPDDGEGVSVNAELSLRAIGKKDEVVSSAELTNRMMQNANQDIVEAEGIYADGKFIGAVPEMGRVEEYLEDTLDEYLKENKYDSASFTKEITAEQGYYVEENIVSYDEMIDLLQSEVSTDQYYTVQQGDTPLGIASSQDVDYHDLIAWNPNIENELFVGDEVVVGVSEPYLPIEATTTDVYTKSIDYKTKKEKTDSLSVGQTKVKQKGKKGKQTITAEVTLVNGVETDRDIVSKETTKEPVDKIVLVGTKKPDPVTVPSGISTNNSSNSTGISLSWPTNGGYISSGYGSRWGSFHRAIDIAKAGGCYGDAIYAAAGGTVTYAGYCGTFGKLIKVSHGNGLETWYAHCSGFNVSVGSKVSRGQTIGYIGNTGRSTGPHLHFQVMVNGQHTNPLNYLK